MSGSSGGGSIFNQFWGMMPYANAAYGGSTASKNSYLNGSSMQGLAGDRAKEAFHIWLAEGGVFSPIQSTVAAGSYFSRAATQDALVASMGPAEYLLHTPGFITPGTEWGRTMNNSIERSSASPEDLIRDEFGPAAAADFANLPAAAQRMMIFQAQLNKADRVNKAMTERIQRLHSMLMDIIRNFKG